MESVGGAWGSLFVLLASESRKAVVFGRGPSRQVLLFSWDRETDRVTPLQWLKGNVHEHRCDLSPSGEWLVSFAALSEKLPSVTAVCRLPSLAPMALWPKYELHGGGGLFDSNSSLRLDHGPDEQALAPGMRPPEELQVAPLRPAPSRADDLAIFELRLFRDGWCRLSEAGTPVYRKGGSGRSRGLELQMRLSGSGLGGGTLRAAEFCVIDPESSIESPLGWLDWADWDSTGELLFARGGRIFRFEVRPSHSGKSGLGALREVADLCPFILQEQDSPSVALCG